MKNLNKLFLALLLAAFLMPAFQSCKKGANDPAISLKSRTSRLSGEWTVTSCKSTNTSGTTLSTYTFNDGVYSESVTGSTAVTGTYTWTISIDKKGTFKDNQTVTVTGTSYISNNSGTWYWIGANSTDKIKNKQMIGFYQTTITNGTNTNTYSGIPTIDDTWNIDQLKSKEVILTSKTTRTISGSTSTNETTLTLTQK